MELDQIARFVVRHVTLLRVGQVYRPPGYQRSFRPELALLFQYVPDANRLTERRSLATLRPCPWSMKP